MRVLVLQHAKEDIRGKVSRYMQEVRPFVFVGEIGKKTADGIWEMVCSQNEVDAVFVEPCKGEQGYAVRTFNNPDYEPALFDEIILFGQHQNIENNLFEYLLGKTDPVKSLMVHSIEAAVIAKEICLNGFMQGSLKVLAKKMEVDFFDLVSLVVFVTSIHDIGKIHPDFQFKMAHALAEKDLGKGNYYSFLLGEKLTNKTYEVDEKIDDCRHEKYAIDVLKRIMKNDSDFSEEIVTRRFTGIDLTTMAENIVKVVSYHHQGKDGSFFPIVNNVETWESVQNKFYYAMKSLFAPRCFRFDDKVEKYVDLFFYITLGIVMFSDFLASSGNVYSSTNNVKNTDNVDELKSYEKLCTVEAKEFMERNAFGSISIKNIDKFSDVFEDIKTPRPMQAEIQKLFSEIDPSSIASIIIEDVCGSGKTEAGMYGMVKTINSKEGNPGMYIGMPTHATAEALLPRFKSFCKAIGLNYKPEFYTAHSMFVENDPDLGQDEMEAWLNNQYYKMAYPFAIGSVDQAMSGVRKEKYSLLRFIGVMSKGILLDEVHAYDSYMLVIIEALLRFCFILENPVIMMSATLPCKMKKQLIKSVTGSDYAPISAYPLITVLLKDGTVLQRPVQCWHEEKEYNFAMHSYMNRPDKIATHVLNLASDGGCVGCVLNTVNEAIDVYEYIKAIKDDDIDVFLFHGRFFENDKEKKTKDITYLFGKQGKADGKRPKKAIVVSTQILEQSIDIDFDYLCTVLAPIDAVLQRLGRMWRHSSLGTYRERNKINCPLHIYVPWNSEMEGYGNSGKYIYGDSVLEETERVLRSLNNKVVIPNDIPTIVNEVYDHAAIKDNGMYAAVGNLNVGSSKYFTMDDNFVPKDLASTRYSEVKTVAVVFADQEDYAKMLNDDWNNDLCLKLLKERTISSVPFTKIQSANYIVGKKLLKDRIIVSCHYRDNLLVADNVSICYGDYGLEYRSREAKVQDRCLEM